MKILLSTNVKRNDILKYCDENNINIIDVNFKKYSQNVITDCIIAEKLCDLYDKLEKKKGKCLLYWKMPKKNQRYLDTPPQTKVVDDFSIGLRDALSMYDLTDFCVTQDRYQYAVIGHTKDGTQVIIALRKHKEKVGSKEK